MPSKKKKYNARFPAGRIKKIMQSDEEIGKVAQAVPVIISRTLELFVESLLTKTLKITNSRNAKTLSTSHMKQCIMSEQRFDFLRELVKSIPDINVAEEASNYNDEDARSSPEDPYPDSDTPYDLSMPSTSARASTSRSTSVASNGYAYTRSKSVNGNNNCNNNINNLKRDYDVVQRLQQHIENRCQIVGTPTTSVIMHTTAVSKLNCEQTPAKLLRSESTPTARSSTISSRTATTAKSRQIDTAIPAPIVNYELNKPIVKIDYSNIHIPQTDAPLSAPAHINASAGEHSSSAFTFASAPVINIDLSNITVGESISCNTPAIATISIGELPPIATASPLLPSTPTASTKLTPNSKAKMATPLFSAVHSHTGSVIIPTKPTATIAKNSFFELDEDYDNI